MDAVVVSVLWANYLLMMALWWQARTHLKRSRKGADDLLATCQQWQRIAKQLEDAYESMKRANGTSAEIIASQGRTIDRLNQVIDGYKALVSQ